MRAKYRPNLVFQWAIFAVLVAIVWALGSSRGVLFFSVLLAYLCHPLVSKLEARGLPRWAATGVTFLVTFSPLIIFMAIATPFIITNLVALIQAFPEWVALALQKFETFADTWGFELPVKHTEVVSIINEKMHQLSLDMVASSTDFVRKSANTASGIILFLLNLALMPVVFIYLVYDFVNWRDGVNNLTPIHLRPTTRRLSHRMDIIVGSYFRGQLLASLTMGTIYGVGLQLVGLPFGWLIGGLTGFFSFIPYLGFSIGALVAFVTAFASGEAGPGILPIICVLAFGQMVENFIVVPRLVGRFVGLNPVETLLALIVCGNLFGFPGLLLAIPTSALFKEAFQEMRRLAGT